MCSRAIYVHVCRDVSSIEPVDWCKAAKYRNEKCKNIKDEKELDDKGPCKHCEAVEKAEDDTAGFRAYWDAGLVE